MAFKRTLTPTFQTEVKVPIANGEGGHDISSFIAEFKRFSSTDLDELRGLPNRELIKRALVGWKMEDEETKEAVPYTPANLAAALEIAPTPMQISVAFWEAVNGARAKNL